MRRIIKNVKFNSIASIRPKLKISSDEIIQKAPKKERIYLQKTAKNIGVIYRNILGEKETYEELASKCCRTIMKKQKIDVSTVKSIVSVSQTSSNRMPSSARKIHGMLDLDHECIAFDINDGCSGYIHSVFLSSLLLKEIGDKSIIVAGDVISNHLSKEDFSNQLLMGDGITCTVLEKAKDGEDIYFILGTNGKDAEKIRLNNTKGNNFEMDGFGVFAFTMRILPDLLNSSLDFANIRKEQIQLYYLHQANKMILEKFERKMNINSNQNIKSIEEFGNTGPASIPITVVNSPPSKKSNICMLGFGAGLSWGSLITKNFNPSTLFIK